VTVLSPLRPSCIGTAVSSSKARLYIEGAVLVVMVMMIMMVVVIIMMVVMMMVTIVSIW
jgi:hypothetical protein